jgi:hypothetical protein
MVGGSEKTKAAQWGKTKELHWAAVKAVMSVHELAVVKGLMSAVPMDKTRVASTVG